jgi:hypothetical protein
MLRFEQIGNQEPRLQQTKLKRLVRAGVGLTNALIAVRQMVDAGWAPPNTPQDILSTSLAYGVYMSVSSNLRYQVQWQCNGSEVQGVIGQQMFGLPIGETHTYTPVGTRHQ